MANYGGIDIGGCGSVLAAVIILGLTVGGILGIVALTRTTADLEVQRERAAADHAWAQASIEAERHQHREIVLAMVIATTAAMQHDWQFMAVVAVLVGLLLWLLFDERRRRDGQG